MAEEPSCVNIKPPFIPQTSKFTKTTQFQTTNHFTLAMFISELFTGYH